MRLGRFASVLFLCICILSFLFCCSEDRVYKDNRAQFEWSMKNALSGNKYYKYCFNYDSDNQISIFFNNNIWYNQTEIMSIIEQINRISSKYAPFNSNDTLSDYCCEYNIVIKSDYKIATITFTGTTSTVDYTFKNISDKVLKSLSNENANRSTDDLFNISPYSDKTQKRIQLAEYLNNNMGNEAHIFAKGKDSKILRYEASIMDDNFAHTIYMGTKDQLEEYGFEWLECSDGYKVVATWRLFPK